MSSSLPVAVMMVRFNLSCSGGGDLTYSSKSFPINPGCVVSSDMGVIIHYSARRKPRPRMAKPVRTVSQVWVTDPD